MGQPRKIDAKRRRTTTAGRAAAPLGPTAMRARRCLALGIPVTVSPDLPLDVLLAKRLITADQHRAGCAYVAVGRVYRLPVAARAWSGTSGQPSPGTGLSSDEAREQTNRQIDQALKSLPRRAVDELENATHHCRLPRAVFTGDQDCAELRALRSGLDAVAQILKGAKP